MAFQLTHSANRHDARCRGAGVSGVECALDRLRNRYRSHRVPLAGFFMRDRMRGMKASVIVLIALSVLLLMSGVGVARGSDSPAAWIGAFLPALAFLYLTVRVARDT
jgi:hypothetical protein